MYLIRAYYPKFKRNSQQKKKKKPKQQNNKITYFKTEQRTDIFPKMTYKWPTDTWTDAQHL